MLKLRNFRYIFVCISVVFFIAVGILGYAHIFNKSPEPNSVRISLSESGTIADFRFQVKKHFPYWFSINFWFSENDKLERARIRKLLGGPAVDKKGKPLEPGISTPVSLKIFAICEDGREIVVYSQDVDPVLTSWGQVSFGKNIGHYILPPGTYRASLINRRATQELSSIHTTFEIGMPAKVGFDPKNVTKGNELC